VDVSAVHDWIKSQTRPVIVLHHQPEEMYSSTRRLSHFSVEGSNTTTTVPLTEAQISQYQVFYRIIRCGWGTLIFVVTTDLPVDRARHDHSAGVCYLLNIEYGGDP
jgi:hypothetical protein